MADCEHCAALRAEVEDAHRREACAADLAREWEQHCKTAEAGVARLTAENEKLDEAMEMLLTDVRRTDLDMSGLKAENERLSAYAKRAAMDVLLCKDGNILLHEKNEKLRAALRQIAGIDVWDNNDQGYVDKARAALSASQPAQEAPAHE